MSLGPTHPCRKMTMRSLLLVLSTLVLAAQPALAQNGMAGDAAPLRTDAITPAPAGQVIALGDLKLVGPFSRATPPRAPTGGAYFTIVDTGTEGDRLLSASTPLADEVQMHEMSVQNDIMRMRQVTAGLRVPEGGELALTPSGTHIMLVGLKQPLLQGETLPLTLVFERSGTITLDIPIASVAARQAP